MAHSCSYTEIDILEETKIITNFLPMETLLISVATLEAQQSVARYKVGCAINCGRYIFRGRSQIKTHPLQRRFNSNEHKIHLHAEIHALSKCGSNDELETAVVIRRLQIGYGNSCPCDPCLAALSEFGVKKILFYHENNWREFKMER